MGDCPLTATFPHDFGDTVWRGAMIHPNDREAMEKMFRGEPIPAAVLEEYDMVRGMADCYNVCGQLGPGIVISMLRRMGYGRIAYEYPEHVEWRNYVGKRVAARYGDTTVEATLQSLGMDGRLVLDTDAYGRIELPRRCVSVLPEKVVQVARGGWEDAEEGASVVVQTDTRRTRGKFVGASEEGVKVKIGAVEQLFPYDEVELQV